MGDIAGSFFHAIRRLVGTCTTDEGELDNGVKFTLLALQVVKKCLVDLSGVS